MKIPNAALRYKPELPPESAAGTLSKNSISGFSTYAGFSQCRSAPGTAGRSAQRSGQRRIRMARQGPTTAIVWKILADKSLRPVQIHVGLTDHTYTALTSGDLKPGDELVTGATTG